MSSDPSVEFVGTAGNGGEGEADNDSQKLSSTDPPQPPLKTKKFTSPVWKDFTYITKKIEKLISGVKKEVQISYARCKTCKKEIEHTGSMGTSHLSNHTKRCPMRAASDVRQQLIQVSNKTDGTSKISNYEFNDKMSQYLLAQTIIVHELPFNIVTYRKLQEYLHSLRPEHVIPSRTTMTKLCKNVYDDEKKKLYDLFCGLESKISITMDKWTASSQNKSYMCITAHFVDKDWKLQKRIISFFNINGATGLDICNALLSRLLDWNVDNKLLSVVVDNEKANDVALRSAKTRLGNNLFCEGIFFHVRCAAHVINLIVQDGVKIIEKVIEKVRNSVKYFTCSPKMEANFLDFVKQCQIKYSKSLCLDVATRWNSTYFMLSVALEYKLVFKRYAIKDSLYTNCPTDDEWEHIETLCGCLKHFSDVTDLLSGSKYVTANLLFEEFCEVHLLLVEWSQSFDKCIVAMSAAMKKKFDKYWKMYNKIFIIAVFLDPRYKVSILEFFFKEIYSQFGYRMYLDNSMNVIKKLFEEYSKLHANNTQSSAPVPVCDSIDVVVSEPSKKKSRFDAYMESRVPQQVKSELDIYIEEDLHKWIGEKDKFDVLSWWQQHCGKYPILGKMARDVFAIPVSTVASESAFSTGGRVIDPYRSRLTPTMVEALLCAQDWIKANYEVLQESDDTIEIDVISSPKRDTTSEVMRDDGDDILDIDDMDDGFW